MKTFKLAFTHRAEHMRAPLDISGDTDVYLFLLFLTSPLIPLSLQSLTSSPRPFELQDGISWHL